MTLKLSGLNIEDLQEVRARVEAAVRQKRRVNMQGVFEQMEALAAQEGFTVDQVIALNSGAESEDSLAIASA